MPAYGRIVSGSVCAVGGGGSLAPSILAITSELPWPLHTGGHLRTFHMLRALARRFRVRLVSPLMAVEAAGVASLEAIGIDVCPVKVGPRTAAGEAVRAATAAVRGEPYVFFRRHDRLAVDSEITYQLSVEPPTLFYYDHLDPLVYDRLRRECPLVIDLHNVYSRLARRLAAERPDYWVRSYLKREAGLLEKMEERAARVADLLLAVSEDEGHYFRGLDAPRVKVVPNGVDCEAFRALPTGRSDRPPLILYLGSMTWGPNISAAIFLARKVLPGLRERLPDARLRIVGRSPVPEVMALAGLPGVEVIADAPEVGLHLREARVMAVPLDTGGGTRLKILEAFAAGLPVVSTPIGCEGIEAAHGSHLLIAGRDRFDECVQSLLEDAALGVRLAGRARELARDRYDWRVVGDTLCEAVRDILDRAGRPAGRARR